MNLTAGDPGSGGGIRRLDQRTLASRGQLSPPASQAFIGRLVVIFGTTVGTGLFVYNGSPHAGNPPVFWVVPPGVAADPYTNALPGGNNVMGVGVPPNGPELVIDQFGDLVVRTSLNAMELEPFTPSFRSFAGTVQPQIIIDGQRSAEFYYSPAGAVNTLAGSVAPTGGGTETYGNTYQQGFTSYLIGTPSTYTSMVQGEIDFARSGYSAPARLVSNVLGGIQIISGTTAGSGQQGNLFVQPGTVPGPAIATLTDLQFNLQPYPAGITSFIATGGLSLWVDSVPNSNMVIAGTLMAAPAFGVTPVTAELVELDGRLTMQDKSIPATPGGAASILFSRVGHMVSKSSDGSGHYSMEHVGAISSNTVGSPQLINAVGLVNVTGLGGVPVGAADYLVVAWIRWVGNQAAGAPVFQFTAASGATVSDSQIGFFDFSGANSNESMVTVGASHTGPTLRNGSGDMSIVLGYANVTAAGNLNLQAATTVAADTYNITGAWVMYFPIT